MYKLYLFIATLMLLLALVLYVIAVVVSNDVSEKAGKICFGIVTGVLALVAIFITAITVIAVIGVV